MKKLFYVLFGISLLFCTTVGCKGTESESVAPEVSQVPTVSKPVETPAIEEITEADLLEQFSLVYEDCGASASQADEQLTIELSALGDKVKADKKAWPEDYENQYKAWRNNIIEEQAAALRAEYEEIISGRERYTLANSYGIPETQGLFYADYLDLDDNGRKELLMLTWTDSWDNPITLEIYQEENGHAVKCFEQNIDLLSVPDGTCLSLVENEKNVYLQATGYEMHQGSEFCSYLMFGINEDQFGLVDWITYESLLEDSFAEQPTYEIHHRSMNLDNSYTEITEEQYQAILSKYKPFQTIANVNENGLYSDTALYTGVLLPIQRTPAKIELNGQLMELSAEAYAEGGVFMAPLRDVLETIGMPVYANSDASVILSSTKKDTVTITNCENFSYSTENGLELPEWALRGRDTGYHCYLNELCSPNSKGTDIRAEIIGGKMFVSIEKIVPLFGFQTNWDSKTKTMRITGEIPASDQMSDLEINDMANFNLDDAIQVAEQNGYSYYSLTGMNVDDYSDVHGGIEFKNGKANWRLYVVEEEHHYDGGFYANLFRVDVMSDGTVMVYPEDKAIVGAGQF